jgi:large subunit ribosomal protein L21e
MVRKSYGKKRRTRHKLKLEKRIAITRFLQEFGIGDRVHVDISTNKNIPHPKFQGLTGKVVGKRGASYIVMVKDGNATKRIFIKPEHLKK